VLWDRRAAGIERDEEVFETGTVTEIDGSGAHQRQGNDFDVDHIVAADEIAEFCSFDDRVGASNIHGTASKIKSAKGIALELHDLRVGHRVEEKLRAGRRLEEIEPRKDGRSRACASREDDGGQQTQYG